MKKLLTIAIPTYNRATLLDKQLAWLANAIKGFEAECKILVSDNCSTDNTQEVIQKWQNILQGVSFKNNKNSENIGVMRNLGYCIGAADTDFMWMIGDDDRVEDKAVPYVFKNLKEHPELSLLTLNFSCRYEPTNEILYDRVFQIENEEVNPDGKAVFQRCLKENHSGIGFLTAQIYRTDVAQKAIKTWEPCLNNLEGQVYWVGYCAAHGSVKVSKETYVESVFGLSYWMRDPKVLLRMQYIDLPSIYAELEGIGYPKQYCRSLILNHFITNNWRVFFGSLRRWPVLTINTIIPYLNLVSVSLWQIIFPHQSAESGF
jgi:abequosyltransferase